MKLAHLYRSILSILCLSILICGCANLGAIQSKAGASYIQGKCFVSKSGTHKISKSNLSGYFGISQEQVDSTYFSLKVKGSEIPSYRQNGDVLFNLDLGTDYCLYSSNTAVIVSVSENAIPNVLPDPLPEISWVKTKVEQQNVLREDLFVLTSEEIPTLDMWMWRTYISKLSTRSNTFPVQIDGIVSTSDCVLTVNFRGASSHPHLANVSFNGQKAYVAFSNYSKASISMMISNSLIRPTNSLSIFTTNTVNYDSFCLNNYFLEYSKYSTGLTNEITLIEPYITNLLDETNSAEYVIAYNKTLYSSVTNLANYRQQSGLSIKMVDIERIFDAFTYGNYDGRAIKYFIEYSHKYWQTKPRYVVLAGQGSIDYHNYTSQNKNLIPTDIVISSTGYGAYLANQSVRYSTNIIEYPCAVGRIPAVSNQEMNDYIDKVKRFEKLNTPINKMVIAADNADFAGDYDRTATILNDLVQEKQSTLISIASDGFDNARQTFISELNGQNDVAIYIGHANVSSLAEELLFRNQDVYLLTNENPYVFFSLSCLAGMFGYVSSDSVCESMIIKTRFGAVATIASPNFTANWQSEEVSKAMLDNIYNKRVQRLGDAWIATRDVLMYNSYYSTMNLFSLLGDPALIVNYDPEIVSIRNNVITWHGPSDTRYEIQRGDSIYGDFQKIAEITSTNIITSYTDTNANAKAFYRIARLF